MAQALQEEEHFGVLFIEQQHTIGLFAVPTGSTGLLDVALQAAAGGVVDDRSHIFAVNAHAESAGGGDDVEFTVLELPEQFPLLIFGNFAVVVGGLNASLLKLLG